MKSFNRFIYICLISLLSACATEPEKSVDEIISDAVRSQTEEPLEDQPDEMTAEDYIGLASESTGKQREQYLLQAAELMLKRGDINLAKSQLETLDAETGAPSQQHQISLLAAKIALANENPRQAIELLPLMKELPLPQYIVASQITADANVDLGYPLTAVRIRVELEHYLQTDEEKEQNHEAIWAALQRTPDVSLVPAKTDKPTTRGWIELARDIRLAQADLTNMQDVILDWGTRHPNHPVSNLFLTRLLTEYQLTYTPAHMIAVMLPLQLRP